MVTRGIAKTIGNIVTTIGNIITTVRGIVTTVGTQTKLSSTIPQLDPPWVSHVTNLHKKLSFLILHLHQISSLLVKATSIKFTHNPLRQLTLANLLPHPTCRDRR
jgi:hypothetical protein